jgi:hypothetical protein
MGEVVRWRDEIRTEVSDRRGDEVVRSGGELGEVVVR